MTEERRVTLVAEVDTTQTQQGFQQIGQQAESMSQRVGAAGQHAQAAVDQIGAGAERSSQRIEAAQRNLIGAIQRTSAAMESGSRTSAQYYETLASQRGVNVDALRPYLEQLRAIEAQQRNNANGLQLVGQSAAQTAAALRQVPAQLTDIVVGLQGGQRPLTVLLQQGGQLRDMFGSIGNVFRALGSTIAGLITPMTTLAAAAAALALAYNQGSKEADAYNKALITTGNAAGTTANQLSDMARAIRGSSQFTQGAASEALAALVQTGKVPADQLQQFATVALKVQRAIGTSVQDTAKDFAELGKAPLQASEKLNEQLNYLTSDVYKQIKAFQDLGKTSEAAAVAQQAYADALSGRSDELESKLGTLEKAWRAVGDAAKGAWDKILDIGRPDTLEQKLADVQKKIAAANLQRGSFINAPGAEVALVDLRAQETSLQNKIQLEKTVSGIKAEQKRFNEADIAWQKEGEQFLDKKQLMEREIAASRERGLASGQSDAAIATREAEIRKKYAGEFKDGIEAQIEAIKRRGDIEETVAQRSLNALNAQREVQKAGEGLQQNRLSALQHEMDFLQATADLEDAAEQRARVRLQQQLALKAKEENSLKDQADLRGQIAALDEKALTRRLKLQAELNALQDKSAITSLSEGNARLDVIDATNDGLQKQIQAQQQANEAIGLSTQQVAALNAAMLDEIATRKESDAAILDTILGREAEAASLTKSAELYRKLAQEQRAGILKSIDFEQQKAFWTSLEQTAHQTFTSIFEGGKNAAQRLKDTFKNVFFDWLYQMTVKKWVINIAGSFGVNTAGVFGAAGAAEQGGGLGGLANLAGAASGASGLAGGGSLLSIGSSLFSSIKGGLDGLSGTIADAVQSLQYGTGLSSSLLTNNAFSTFAGAAGSSLAGFGIGSALNKGLSGQFSLGGGLGTVEKLATGVASVFAGPLGGAIAGAIGGLANRLFGRGPKEVTATGIRGTFSGESFSGQAFADFLQKGGLFRSDKRGTDLSPLATEQQQAFDNTFKGIKDSTAAFATALGLSTDVITGYSKQINLTLTKDQAENEKLIADLFSGIGNELATALLPNLAEFSKTGEQASATLQRVATDFTAVGAVFKGLGIDIDQALGAIGIASLAAREHLIDLAGGINNLVSQSAFFQQNFLSDAEKIAPVQQQVSQSLDALGYSSVKTVAQFHDAVLALTSSGALATEAGQKAFAGLLAIAPQFKQVADYIDQAAKASEDLAKAQQAQAEQAQANAKNAAQTAFSALGGAIQRQKDAVTAQYSSFIGSLSNGLSGLNSAMAGTRAIIKTVRDAINNFAMPGEEAKMHTNARQRLHEIAQGNRLPDENAIQQAIGEATQFNADDFASAFELNRAQALTRNDLEAIGKKAEDQLSAQERSALIVESWKAEYEAQEQAQLNALDSQLGTAQAQLDALNGINTSVLSVRDAMADFAAAMRAASAMGAPAGGGSGGAGFSTGSGIAGGKTPFNIDWWENTVVDFSKNQLSAPEIVAPVLVANMAPASNMQGVEKRLESLETVMTSSMMNLTEHSKATADTLTQFNLQGMPAERT